MKENKIYTAVDFERYHTGSMPASEMHDLEKAALEDPFLADALEGYALSSSAKKDMLQLRERLFKKGKNKIATPVYSLTRSAWWRIAALFIIIAGAGIIFYKINISSKQNTIAKTDDKKSLRADSNVSLSNADTAPSQRNVAFQNSPAAKSEENKRTPLRGIKAEPDRKISALSSPKKESEDDMANVAVSGQNKKSFNEYVLKGKVTDREARPLASASLKKEKDNHDEITSTDTAGKFLIKSPDSNATAMVSAAGYATKKVALQKDSQPVITMDRNGVALTEAVVAAADRSKTARKKETESRVLSAQAKPAVPSTNNPQFDKYVKQHIKPVYDENKVGQTGDVKLSFTIGKEGKPENIKLESSSCKACETQAIELLKNGPLWNNETSTGKTVLIKF